MSISRAAMETAFRELYPLQSRFTPEFADEVRRRAEALEARVAEEDRYYLSTGLLDVAAPYGPESVKGMLQ